MVLSDECIPYKGHQVHSLPGLGEWVSGGPGAGGIVCSCPWPVDMDGSEGLWGSAGGAAAILPPARLDKGTGMTPSALGLLLP